MADELGEERAGQAFMRGAQAAPAGALMAIPLSVILGRLSLRLPIILGGVLMILLALFLVLVMTEEGFVPTPPQKRTTWRMMLRTGQDAQFLVRRRPILLALSGTSFLNGLCSDWRSTKHRGTALRAWFKLNIDDSQVRATLFSVSGQADAIGQIVGGPDVGAIGNRSLRTALLTSAALLAPVLPLNGVVLRQVRMR